jgi:hypothetical protein
VGAYRQKVISRLTMLDPYTPRAYSAACFPAYAGIHAWMAK